MRETVLPVAEPEVSAQPQAGVGRKAGGGSAHVLLLQRQSPISAFCGPSADQTNTHAPDRKAYAQAFTQSRYAPILFKMLDGKPYANLIWKMLEPQGAMPFKRDEI